MTDAASRQLQTWLIGALFLIAGSLASLLWQNQQQIIQQLSDRIGRMEVSCKVDWLGDATLAQLAGVHLT